jgi:hypothetical protein
MSGAKEVAKNAISEIEPLIAEMLDGKWLDNEVSLGRLLSSDGDIQVQLKITKIKKDFLFSDEEDSDY